VTGCAIQAQAQLPQVPPPSHALFLHRAGIDFPSRGVERLSRASNGVMQVERDRNGREVLRAISPSADPGRRVSEGEFLDAVRRVFGH
jgi:hypothetical protein